MGRNEQIRAWRDAGMAYAEIARRLKINVGTAWSVINRPAQHVRDCKLDRDAQIVAMRKTGAIFSVIGLAFGLTAHRVQAICTRWEKPNTRSRLAPTAYVSPVMRQFLYAPRPR